MLKETLVTLIIRKYLSINMSQGLSKSKAIVLLFIPFILNFTISTIISGIVVKKALAEGVPYEEIGFRIMRELYTHSYYWSIIQVAIGIYIIKLIGGFDRLKELYSKSDFLEKPITSFAVMIGLVAFSLGIIFLEQFLISIQFGDWKAYMESWNRIVREIPLASRLYLVMIAPFTAGIFEEIIWRVFGITVLERFMSTRKAIILQAVAFGIWHGLTWHAIVTFIIGLVYGYVFAKRRKLLVLSSAHIITDIIGFGLAFLR